MEPSLKFTLCSGGSARLTGARLGSLVFGHGGGGGDRLEVATPAVILYTQAGSVPHLTQDNLARLLAGYGQSQNGDTTTRNIKKKSHPLLISLQTTNCMRRGVAAVGRGISRFCGFANEDGASSPFPAIVVIQDPLKETPTGYNDRAGVCIWEDGGKSQLTPADISDLADIFRPAAYQALSDGDTPKGCSKKRLDHAVKRSLDYLDFELRTRAEKRKTLAAAGEGEVGSPSLSASLLASIQGGFNEVSRKFSVQDTLKRDVAAVAGEVAGFILDGFHSNGETATKLRFAADDLEPLLTPTLAALPADKPRFMFGAYPPELMMALARAGVDCFDSSFACLQTDKNRALVFTFEQIRDGLDGERHLQLDDATVYRDDMRVIDAACGCYTCRQGFTRAYINHLLVTKELLAAVLLQMHNLHHLLRFVDALRADLIGKQTN